MEHSTFDRGIIELTSGVLSSPDSFDFYMSRSMSGRSTDDDGVTSVTGGELGGRHHAPPDGGCCGRNNLN
jgi:hypothetical protein